MQAITIQADVSNELAVRNMFGTLVAQFGRVDIVVSNSGIEHFGALDQDTPADIDRVFGVNVKGQYFVAQMAYKYMQDFGRVVLTSSISAVKVCLVLHSLQSFFIVIVHQALTQG